MSSDVKDIAETCFTEALRPSPVSSISTLEPRPHLPASLLHLLDTADMRDEPASSSTVLIAVLSTPLQSLAITYDLGA